MTRSVKRRSILLFIAVLAFAGVLAANINQLNATAATDSLPGTDISMLMASGGDENPTGG